MSEEAQPTEATSEPPPKAPPAWEYRSELKIISSMRELVGITKMVMEQEVARTRRKLEKLKYGS